VPEKFERFNPSAHPLAGSDMDATESALQFIRTFRDERFFLYVHYMDVHQYLYDRESAKFGSGYADAYDNAIHWVDSNIGVVVNELAEQKIFDRTLIVVAADHGEAFSEHGREGHARDLYTEVTEVPLIFVLPQRLPRGVVVDQRVANVDIWPTILDLLGLPPMAGAQGHSLRALIGPAANREPAPSERAQPIFAHIDQTWGRRGAEPRPLVAVDDGRYRLLHHLGPRRWDELYDLERDPREQTNRAPEQPEVVARLAAQIEDYLRDAAAEREPAPEVEMDAGQLEQLRALGYDVKQPAPDDR
jgi:arylsulfatase A-like enzyme